MVPPVTKPTAPPAGRPSRSSTHASAMSSTAVAAGVTARMPAFWSHAEVSQSAAIAAGCVPPITNPKNRPEGIAVRPGSAAWASRSTTSVRIGRVLGQVGAESRDHVGDRGGRGNGAVGQGGQPPQGVLVSAGEDFRGVR